MPADPCRDCFEREQANSEVTTWAESASAWNNAPYPQCNSCATWCHPSQIICTAT